MRRVIQLAKETSESGAGGVFAAVIVKNGEIVGEGVNRVIAEKDPTWHGEVSAIRDACRKLGTHDLTGAVAQVPARGDLRRVAEARRARHRIDVAGARLLGPGHEVRALRGAPPADRAHKRPVGGIGPRPAG